MWCEQLRLFRVSQSWEKDPDWVCTEDLKRRIREKVGSPPRAGLTENLFNEIIGWKLRGQRGRTEDHRAGLTAEVLGQVTACAFSIRHDDPAYLAKVRADLLMSLPGVGLGVGSAILAMTFPEEYGVIDFRVWKVIFNQDRRMFIMSNFLQYLAVIRECAGQLGWQVQHVDFFAWKYYEVSVKG